MLYDSLPKKKKKLRENPCGLIYQESNPVSWGEGRQKGLLG